MQIIAFPPLADMFDQLDDWAEQIEAMRDNTNIERRARAGAEIQHRMIGLIGSAKRLNLNNLNPSEQRWHQDLYGEVNEVRALMFEVCMGLDRDRARQFAGLNDARPVRVYELDQHQDWSR